MKLACLVASVMGASAMVDVAHGQTSEALMDALVRKGILTEQEAEDIKADLARENAAVNNVRAPGKNTAGIELSGDFRGRFENFTADDDSFTTRNRWRYRLRVQAEAEFYERFEVGLRLASGEGAFDDVDAAPLGGDPISGNQTFNNNASGKDLWVDKAYATWRALETLDSSGSLTFGKMSNPFVFSPLVFDSDYTPEGLATSWSHAFNDEHMLGFAAGGFVLDEISGDSDDPYMLGAQLRFDSIWSYNEAHKPKLSTSAGVAVLSISNEEMLTNVAVPNGQQGNSRTPAGVLDSNFNPFVLDGTITYYFDSAPLYNGFFPVSLVGNYINNPAARSDDDGYSIGIQLGKAGKKATWSLAYEWRHLGRDAWYEEIVDSDFGALYTAAFPGGRTGYRPGTNIEGHIVTANYSPYNALTLGVTWFYTHLIDEPAGSTGDGLMSRLQVDAMLKF